MKTLEEYPKQSSLDKELEIIGGGPKGSRRELAEYYHQKVYERLPFKVILYLIELTDEREEKIRHREEIAHFDFDFLLKRVDEKLQNPERKENFFPKEIFGFYGERMMRDFLSEFRQIEAVESSTEKEDSKKGIDMFVKFKGIDSPLAIQFTLEDEKKKKNLYGIKTTVKRPNSKSKINPKEPLKCSLALVKGDGRIFDRTCDEWFRKSKEESKKEAIDYLPEKEKLHLLLQLLRIENEEENRKLKEEIGKMVNPYLEEFFKKYYPKLVASFEKFPPISLWSLESLEKMIKLVRMTKD